LSEHLHGSETSGNRCKRFFNSKADSSCTCRIIQADSKEFTDKIARFYPSLKRQNILLYISWAQQ
jgi:hypothetical protein